MFDNIEKKQNSHKKTKKAFKYLHISIKSNTFVS